MGPSDPLIGGLSFDSRRVKAGDIFFALPGSSDDGSRYIGQALSMGARAVVHQGPVASPLEGVAYLRVENARAALSPLSAAFFDKPSSRLAVIGVTGTEGKSSTVSFIYQLLRLAGKKAGFVSTVQHDLGGGPQANPEHQTTPEASILQAQLAQMAAAACEFAVIEASSHGLSPRTNRLGDVLFDVAVLTNVTLEHLEFHGSLEAYRADKARLFSALDAHDHRKSLPSGETRIPSFGVVNADDPHAALFRRATSHPVRGFSLGDGPAETRALDVTSDARGSSFILDEAGTLSPARIELPGDFNVKNALAALLAVSGLLDVKASSLCHLLPRLQAIRGRMSRIVRGQPFEVIVDYAHTPSSFEAVLPPLRRAVKGRIICLFGSGGERDREKRPLQGRIAAAWSDIVILADEDPRGEDPMAILEEIALGCPGLERGRELFLMPQRQAAIRKALSLAREGDAVLLLGKGHENSIIGRSGALAYDEIREAEKALCEMGWTAEGQIS